METLYGLKRKTTNRWLKLLLLLFVAVGFGVPNLNAQTKATKVANDRELIVAMDNPSITTIELAPGHYAYLDIDASFGTRVTKAKGSGGDRSSSGCTYWITGANSCFDPTNVGTPDPPHAPLPGFNGLNAMAGVENATCLSFPINCCPGDFSGRWQVTLKPVGATVVFYDTTFYTMPFWVNKPGRYKLKYVWDPAVNPLLTEYAEVETEYNFFGPDSLDLSAPDVCGNTTYLDFDYIPGYDPLNTHTIQWFLDAWPYGDPQLLTGMPTASVDDFPFTVECCGLYILTVRYTDFDIADNYCIKEVSDTIEFSCQPIAMRPGTTAKCASLVSSRASAQSAHAAIQISLVGIGRPRSRKAFTNAP